MEKNENKFTLKPKDFLVLILFTIINQIKIIMEILYMVEKTLSVIDFGMFKTLKMDYAFL